MQMLGDRPGDADAVIGAGASADLIQHHQRSFGGVVEDIRGLVHLDHEGRIAAGEFVGGADPAENPVDLADPGRGGRHPASQMGEQRDEGDLTDIGGFSGHVRAGQQGDLLARRSQARVVGDEGTGAGTAQQHTFYDGMPALFDLEDIRIVDHGPDPVRFPGEFGPAAQDVRLGDGLGGREQGLGPGDDLGQQGLEKLRLPGEGHLVGTQHLAFLGSQFLRGEPFGVHHRLLADIIGRDRGEVGLGDLDGVAEGSVVAHFQRLDAGAVLLVAFEVRDPCLAVRGEGAEPVQLGVETCPQRPAFAQVDGQFIRQGGGELGQQLGLGVDAARQAREGAAGHRREFFADRGQGAEGVADTTEFAGVAQAILQAGQDAGDIADAAKGFADAGRGSRVAEEFADRALPCGDRRQVRRRLRQPQGQQAGARGGLGAVDRVEQGAFALALRRGEEFEITGGGGVQQDRRIELGLDEAEQILRPIAKRVRDVAQDGPRGPERRVGIGEAEAGQAVHRQGLRHETGACGDVEVPAWQS